MYGDERKKKKSKKDEDSATDGSSIKQQIYPYCILKQNIIYFHIHVCCTLNNRASGVFLTHLRPFLQIYRGSNIPAPVLLNLLNELRKRDKM